MNHLYEKNGLLHLCESCEGAPNILLVWTKCEIDVPSNQSFMSEENPTCQKCIALNQKIKSD